jgi:hypothetical protein
MVQVTGLPQVPSQVATTPADQAEFLLQVAAEVEHGLLVQYLYAAYSVDPVNDPVDPNTGHGWQDKLINIAVQEMVHLLNVQNMLLALKRRPYFGRANFPPAPGKAAFYPFPFRFERLSEQSLGKYVTTESAAEFFGGVDRSKLLPDQNTWLDRAIGSGKGAAGQKINHVGVIYGMLYWMCQQDDTPVGPWLLPPEVFVPAGVPHLSQADFGDANLFAREGPAVPFGGQPGPENPPPKKHDQQLHRIIWSVTNPEDARSAIAQIAEQGEGMQISDDSHFLEFLDLFGEFVTKADAGGPIPVLPVPTNPNTNTDPATAEGRITHPGAAAWAKLFNARYRILLTELALALSELPGENTGGKGLAARDLLVTRAINQDMLGRFGIKQLAKRLTKMPLKADESGRAAPPFEMLETEPPSDPNGLRDLLVKLLADAATAVAGILALTGADAPSGLDPANLRKLKKSDDDYSADVALMKFTL